ncbi:prepilin peptidase [Oligella ureolytica]
MFQLFFFLGLSGLSLAFFLPKYLLNIYRRHRGDCYWREVRPYKKRYPSTLVVLVFLASGLELTRLDVESAFYLLFIAILLSLSWLDLS